MNGISLTASMKSNLLSMQQTQKLQDSTQLRLSTGLKVNSAIDNPSSYYTASALNNRAEDLSALLDAMSQGIQTIKAANEALETGTTILQQTKAVAVKASEDSADIVAKVNTEAELLAAVEKGGPGYIVITSDINLTSQIQLKDGQKLVGDNYFAGNDGSNRKLNFDFTGITNHAIMTADNSVISNLDINYQTDQNYAFAVIRSQDVKNVTIANINLSAEAANNTTKSSRLIGFFNSTGKLDGNININSQAAFTGYGVSLNSSVVDINADMNIKTNGTFSYGIYSFTGTANLYGNINIETTQANSNGLNTHNGATINVFGRLNIKTQNTDAIKNGRPETGSAGSRINIYASAQLYLETGGSYAPVLNSNHYLNTGANSIFIQQGVTIGGRDNLGTFFSKASKDIHESNASQTAGQNLKSDYFTAANGFDTVTAWTPFDFSSMIFNQTFSGDNKTEDKFDDRSYRETLSQFDQLINDASYKGINLLEQNNLKINFNEQRSSGIEISGVDASSEALGIRNKNWESRMDILNSIDQLEDAVNQLRSFSAEFGNFYSIVTTREDFTENLINVLTEGADKLTLADMNAESANMLALQTRQQLAVNSLSLASQAAQSVLKLF